MRQRLSLLIGLTTLAATVSLSATAVAADPTPGDGHHGHHDKKYGFYYPYYSPLVPICKQWGLFDHKGNEIVIPYYPGYLPRRHHHGRHGGAADGELWGDGGGHLSADYGPYSGAPQDEARLLHLGGNGPFFPSPLGPTDIIDVIGGSHGAGNCSR